MFIEVSNGGTFYKNIRRNRQGSKGNPCPRWCYYGKGWKWIPGFFETFNLDEVEETFNYLFSVNCMLMFDWDLNFKFLKCFLLKDCVGNKTFEIEFKITFESKTK